MDLSRIPRGMNGSGQRKCQSWIESFLGYTSEREAAPIFRRWTAIATIASVLERKVWARTTKGDLFPNHYIILVGHPGVGKSDTIKAAREMLRELEEDGKVIIAPKNVTAASLIDRLAEAKRTIVRPGKTPPVLDYNATTLLADEFSSLLHTYDTQFMAFLTDIYEGEWYDETRRGGNLKNKIERPCLNILAGTTPSNLCKFMPEGAWDQGFASRTILVYSGDRSVADIFEENTADQSAEYNDLLYDLRIISDLYGKMVFTPEAVGAFKQWRAEGEQPVPRHPKLTHYCTRRTAHIIRLSMVASAARGNDLQIQLEDFENARGWLIEAEMMMPDIFLAGVAGGDSAAIDDTWYFVMKSHGKGVPVMDHQLIHHIRERVPAHSVVRIKEIMLMDGSLKARLDSKTGITTYEPGPRKPTFG